MLLQKIFFYIKEKYSISIDEIEDLFDIEEKTNDLIMMVGFGVGLSAPPLIF